MQVAESHEGELGDGAFRDSHRTVDTEREYFGSEHTEGDKKK